MVIRSPIQHPGVEVGARMMDEAIEEVRHQFRLQIAHETHFHPILVNQRRSPAEIDGDNRKRLVHRQDEVPCPIDSLAISQRLREQLPHDNAHVFNRVMLIDVEIAFRLEFQIECSVFCEQLEHMIEKPDPCRDLISPPAFNSEFAADLRLFSVSLQLSCARQSQPPFR